MQERVRTAQMVGTVVRSRCVWDLAIHIYSTLWAGMLKEEKVEVPVVMGSQEMEARETMRWERARRCGGGERDDAVG